jgi:hypothetical protein
MENILSWILTIYDGILFILKSVWGIWILAGFIVVPALWIYLLIKHRKNKDEFFKILNPGIGLILLILFYYIFS